MPSAPGLELLAPMLASAGPLPAGPGWAWEFKYDGVRAIAYVDERVRVYSRNNNEITETYPELGEAAGLLSGRRAVLDGEIVALDHDQPSFSLLQQRMHTAAPAPRLLQTVPVFYYVFDVLAVDGQDLTGQPYAARRDILAGLSLSGEHVKVPAHFVDADGEKMLQAAEIAGLEGVVAKRLSSPYRAGKRSADWTKVPLIKTQEVIVIGWKPGEGRRAGTIGSLLLAVYDQNDHLSYAGHVGTGFTELALRQLHQQLTPIARGTPAVGDVPREHARHAHWVEPALVGEVTFRSWTPENRLRHASWRGLRTDRAPSSAKRDIFRPAVPAEPEIAYAMVSSDRRVRVEIIRRGEAQFFRVLYGDSVLEGLDIKAVEALMTQLGIEMDALEPVDGEAPGETPGGTNRLPA
jgi:bifunctional non-homologous end joining protein LigD